MNYGRILGVMLLIMASLVIFTVPTFACIPADGTGGNDDITCNSVNPVVGSIAGRDGNDTILVLDDAADSTEDVWGDLSGIVGDDSIEIRGLADNIYGDRDSTGILSAGQAQAGNDTIRITQGGDVDQIFGDFHFRDFSGNTGTNEPIGGDDYIEISASSSVDIRIYGDYVGDNDGAGVGAGGDDTIIIYGRVGDASGSDDSVYGDRVRGGGDNSADGGNDSIRVHVGGLVDDHIRGDDAEDDGGDDTIVVDGTVGGTIYGDYLNAPDICCVNEGGDDSITVSVLGSVGGDVYGDYEASTFSNEGDGGNDTISVAGVAAGTVFGDHIDGDGGNDSLIVGVGGSVGGAVIGDWIIGTSGDGNGGDDTIRILGTTGGSVHGDRARGNGGNDSILVSSGAMVSSVIGDWVDGMGGDDSIVIAGSAVGAMSTISGDFSDGDGGNDTISLQSSGLFFFSGAGVYGDNIQTDTGAGGDDSISILSGTNVDSDVIGDGIMGVDVLGGKDTIAVRGTVTGTVSGDDDDFSARSRRDTITTYSNSYVGAISGDLTKKAGSKDNIVIGGTVENSVFGDNVNRAGGSDFIEVTSSGYVGKNVVGDLAKTIKGGDDDIIIRGTVDRHVIGDGFRESAKPDANGGNDTITIANGAFVDRDVIGDDAPNDGGADSIVIRGTVGRDVIGDKVGGMGGIDTISVKGTGVVQGDVIGDDAGTPANAGNGGDDSFEIIGNVVGDVYLDNRPGPTLDIVGDASEIDLAVGGDDIIVVAGQITGNISSASGNDGDDIFVIADGGVVGGVMDAGAHVDGDSLVFDLSTKSKGEFGKLSDLFDDLTIEDGGVSYRGNQYRWVNFEFLQYAIQLFQTRTVPLYCSGIYEKNTEGTACVRKGQEEYDAIMFHRNNPGYDGRMPGTEACAIYNYGTAMRVYEVVDGSEGELVTTISADVFSHNIESNLLLASSASGNVNVYYLTSNEVQVECRDWSGKTQVRIIPDFSGTVNASFDKDQG